MAVSLGTSENGSGNGGGCDQSLLDKFIQLILAVIVAAFIFFLGVLILQAAPNIYSIMNPTITATQKTLAAIQTWMSIILTILVMVSGYLLLITSVGLLLAYAVMFLIGIAAKVKKAENKLENKKDAESSKKSV